jgi:hypothetical protein
MSKRLLAGLAGTLFMALCPFSHAQTADAAAEMRRLQLVLAVINAEIRSDLDQVLALREVISLNARASPNTLERSPDPVDFDERAQAQRIANQRDAALSRRLDAILARSAALDAQKQPLLERVRSLALLPQESTSGTAGIAR